MQSKDKIKPIKLNMDMSPNLISSDMATFLKNVQWQVNNDSTGGINGLNEGVQTPLVSNIENFTGQQTLPDGDNVCIGSYYDRKLNNLVWFKDRKSTRLNSSHSQQSRMPSSA